MRDPGEIPLLQTMIDVHKNDVILMVIYAQIRLYIYQVLSVLYENTANYNTKSI